MSISNETSTLKQRPGADPGPEPQTDTDSGKDRAPVQDMQTEYGGRKGPDPTRYGDWEKNGRCIDF